MRRGEPRVPGQSRLPGALARARYWARYRFNCYQPYLRLIEFKHRRVSDRIIRDDTELVIEGFGRSASSYAVVAFELAQVRPVRSAHHTHAAAQVVKAARLGLPTIVIVKRPDEVALSHMVRHPTVGPATILRAWMRFHRVVASVADRVLVISLDELNTDYGGAIRRLNERHRTSFVPPPATGDFGRRVHDEMVHRHREGGRPDLHSAMPTPERQRAKEALRHRLNAPELAALRRAANHLYADLTGAAMSHVETRLPTPPGARGDAARPGHA